MGQVSDCVHRDSELRARLFVVERLKHTVLTEENLTKLVEIVHEEVVRAKEQFGERRTAVDNRIVGLQDRLDRLFDALETGALSTNDLAPRIKDLKSRLDELEDQKAGMAEKMREARMPTLSRAEVEAHVQDLHALLGKGSIVERRGFLRTFVKQIEVNPPQMAIDYTIPLKPDGEAPFTGEVLTFAQNGSPV